MTVILAHRANINSPNQQKENTAVACKVSLELGFGLELDVRSYKGKLYAKHDCVQSENEQLLSEIVTVLKDYPELPIAINIKETGNEADLVQSIAQLNKSNIFFFDLELVVGLEKYNSLASVYRHLDSNIEIGIRVSDRKETLERALASNSKIVWLDEFDEFWVSAEVVQALNNAGKKIYAVAPDLHKHPTSISMNRCQEFVEWGVSGICTDYPIKLKNLLKEIV